MLPCRTNYDVSGVQQTHSQNMGTSTTIFLAFPLDILIDGWLSTMETPGNYVVPMFATVVTVSAVKIVDQVMVVNRMSRCQGHRCLSACSINSFHPESYRRRDRAGLSGHLPQKHSDPDRYSHWTLPIPIISSVPTLLKFDYSQWTWQSAMVGKPK